MIPPNDTCRGWCWDLRRKLFDRRAVFCILRSVGLKDAATRPLAEVVVSAVITGCDTATTEESDLRQWATSLFADAEDPGRVRGSFGRLRVLW